MGLFLALVVSIRLPFRFVYFYGSEWVFGPISRLMALIRVINYRYAGLPSYNWCSPPKEDLIPAFCVFNKQI